MGDEGYQQRKHAATEQQLPSDALVVRRKWDAGVKAFFAGLKHYVEAQPAPQP